MARQTKEAANTGSSPHRRRPIVLVLVLAKVSSLLRDAAEGSEGFFFGIRAAGTGVVQVVSPAGFGYASIPEPFAGGLGLVA
uniref:Uncharacterized protein n=1 Tax=Pyricularia oryzae (strain P131) TaxID=1143193 RepID=L7J799_PYRO1